MKKILTVLIIEPNNQLNLPYKFLVESYSILRESTVRDGLKALNLNTVDLVFISASIPPNRSLNILEAIKNKSRTHLIPIVFVIDYTNRLNFVPGTTWGGKISVIDTFANEAQFVVMLDRIYRLIL